MPVPVSDTLVGLVAASLVIVRFPFATPAAVGEKLTTIVFDAPGASENPVAGAANTPVVETDATISVSVPVLVILRFLLPVVPTRWLPKLIDAWSTAIAGAMPVPVSETLV